MSGLMHYSQEPLTFDRDRRYEQHPPMTYRKPVGFWVSVTGEDDWPSWCQGEEFDLTSLQHAHTVTLRPEANVLRIDSQESIGAFHETFKVETDYECRNADVYKSHHWPIDWRSVSEQYDGIIIAPYQYGSRFHHSWYYGWDCASGCVWNLSAVASVDLIGAEVAS